MSDAPPRAAILAPWARTLDACLEELSADPATGLSSTDARERLQKTGPNQLRAPKRRHVVSIIADQLKGVVILLLAVAAALAMLFGDFAEGLAIIAVIVINSGIGFLTEWRATRSMEALRKLGHTDTVVMRDGVTQSVPAKVLVPGDIVIMEGGDIITADIRVAESAALQCDESTLTGESMPVRKQIEVLPETTLLMDRSNIVFKGTSITRGSGRGVVVGTGLCTELGRISELVTEAESHQTPLERRLNLLGQRLAIAVVLIAALIALGGILAGRETLLAIEVAIALAVAAIPEGLPIVATIALARGMWRMAKKNALIARLSAVETLGATSVILTDKTGTLTENRMTATALCLAGAKITIEGAGLIRPGYFRENRHPLSEGTSAMLEEVLTVAALCCNASLHETDDGELKTTGDPTEIALLVAAAQRGLIKEDLQKRFPEIAEVPFDSESKLMATSHQRDNDILVAVKGAPESVLPLCDSLRENGIESPLTQDGRTMWLDEARRLGERGLRTLAIACKSVTGPDADPYGSLVLLGIFGLEDPPREGVREAVTSCHDAGISVVMVTGDHLATARNIAAELGITDAAGDEHMFVKGSDLDALLLSDKSQTLLDARVFSRASPEQKLKLIDLFQRQGYVVAMTGDGVNDAPALKQADIGIAMGIRGTAVAREAAHMVLQDDEFGTIVEAVAQGRAIYDNIQKFVVYLLSCNISEVLIVSLATAAGAPLPLLPLQILFLNLVTDVFPALALGVGQGSGSLMRRQPRPSGEPVLTRSQWLRIIMQGAVISATVLGAMSIAVFYFHFDTEQAVTVSFCTLAFAQLWHVFNMRDNVWQVFNNEITRNPWVWLAILICTILIVLAIYLPLPSELLGLTMPGAQGWLIILPMSLLPIIVGPVVRYLAE
jgi:Ca2+-transporting ATPase